MKIFSPRNANHQKDWLSGVSQERIDEVHLWPRFGITCLFNGLLFAQGSVSTVYRLPDCLRSVVCGMLKYSTFCRVVGAFLRFLF